MRQIKIWLFQALTYYLVDYDYKPVCFPLTMRTSPWVVMDFLSIKSLHDNIFNTYRKSKTWLLNFYIIFKNSWLQGPFALCFDWKLGKKTYITTCPSWILKTQCRFEVKFHFHEEGGQKSKVPFPLSKEMNSCVATVDL